jgi:hypothetical protein
MHNNETKLFISVKKCLPVYFFAYRLVAKRRLCEQRPLLGNAHNKQANNNRTTGFCNTF